MPTPAIFLCFLGEGSTMPVIWILWPLQTYACLFHSVAEVNVKTHVMQEENERSIISELPALNNQQLQDFQRKSHVATLRDLTKVSPTPAWAGHILHPKVRLLSGSSQSCGEDDSGVNRSAKLMQKIDPLNQAPGCKIIYNSLEFTERNHQANQPPCHFN